MDELRLILLRTQNGSWPTSTTHPILRSVWPFAYYSHPTLLRQVIGPNYFICLCVPWQMMNGRQKQGENHSNQAKTRAVITFLYIRVQGCVLKSAIPPCCVLIIASCEVKFFKTTKHLHTCFFFFFASTTRYR